MFERCARLWDRKFVVKTERRVGMQRQDATSKRHKACANAWPRVPLHPAPASPGYSARSQGFRQCACAERRDVWITLSRRTVE